MEILMPMEIWYDVDWSYLEARLAFHSSGLIAVWNNGASTFASAELKAVMEVTGAVDPIQITSTFYQGSGGRRVLPDPASFQKSSPTNDGEAFVRLTLSAAMLNMERRAAKK